MSLWHFRTGPSMIQPLTLTVVGPLRGLGD